MPIMDVTGLVTARCALCPESHPNRRPPDLPPAPRKDTAEWCKAATAERAAGHLGLLGLGLVALEASFMVILHRGAGV